MTALTGYQDFIDRAAAPMYRSISQKQSQNNSYTNKLESIWRNPTSAGTEDGAIPSTAAVPTTALTGSLGSNGPWLGQAASGELWLSRFTCYWDEPAAPPIGSIILCDRLSHQGGLVGNLNTAQTTNLPTAALTRYTSAVGVMAALEVHAFIGTTATTFTASYTNQAGTAARTSGVIDIGGSGKRDGGAFFIMPLQAGDTGVKSVESVTLAATTGTAGNIGVTLFRPLLIIPNVHKIRSEWSPLFGGMCNFVKLEPDYCLMMLVTRVKAGSSNIIAMPVTAEVIEA